MSSIEDIQLVRPQLLYKDSFLRGFDELDSDSDRFAWVYLGDSASLSFPREDFQGYVDTLLKREMVPPAGFVRDSVYWGVWNDEVVGRIALRHELNEFLSKIGGHIGYIVRPSYRRIGVATELLRQVLLTAQAKAIGKLLLTCDENNLASEITISKNNGVFESKVDNGPGRPAKKRFWIDVRGRQLSGIDTR